METTEFIWMNGKTIPWEQAMTHVLTHTLHYGGGVFEGVRCYKTERGTAIFRLKEHMDRLYYSAGILKMEVPWSQEELTNAVVETLRENKLEGGYIRPLIYFGYGKMGLNPTGAPVEAIVACWPWGKYLGHDAVKVKISDFIRIHPRSSVTDAKICGHYVNSIMAVLAIRDTEYHEALFLDYEGYVAEGPGENLFIVKEGVIFTPPLGKILAGITRSTVMEVARGLGYEVVEKALKPEDLFAAEEAFFTGTAAEVSPIASIDDHVYGDGNPGPVSARLREVYMGIVQGENLDYQHYLTYV